MALVIFPQDNSASFNSYKFLQIFCLILIGFICCETSPFLIRGSPTQVKLTVMTSINNAGWIWS